MKLKIPLIIFLILSCSSARAGQGMCPGPEAGHNSGPVCSGTLSSTDQNTSDSFAQYIGTYSFSWASTDYLVSETVFSGFSWNMYFSGTAPAGAALCPYLYNASGGLPTGSPIAAGTPVLASTLTSSPVWTKFNFTCRSITPGTYTQVIKYATDTSCATPLSDNNNFPEARSSAVGTGSWGISTNGTSWSVYNTTRGNYKGYK